MNTIISAPSAVGSDTRPALKFITCGSVDDGKSTLIGRLLVDSKAVLQDHLAGVQRQGETDLALLTDGLSAEREQGITIDVAYRYFNTETRKFIIGDAPGHEQYTRNMVTAASAADAAVVLVDATKLDWQDAGLKLLVQTRRHSLLLKLLRVPSIVFAVNKLDAVADSALAFAHISAALAAFAAEAGITVTATVPVSALKGWNVVDAAADAVWCGYSGPTLLDILEHLPVTAADTALPFAFPVQWVEKFSSSSDTSQGRRVFWGRVATGGVVPGQPVKVMPSGQTATVAQVLDHARHPKVVQAGHSAGIVLDREVDVSRGDWLLAADGEGAALDASREIRATVAWMDDETLVAGRVYWALHGHRWVKAKVKRIVHKLDINTLAEEDATQLEPNAIGHIELALQEPLVTLPFAQSRALGSLVLVDTASHRTSGALLVN
ncbi:MAG: sulfate adenylyltransferase [Gammaproteobacteria bacterium]|uniref:sulfate adenylyltransferase subunit 1 n=1 Tax=Hydrogenophaga TaxID=47420 RepID=UPI001CFB0317|nr:MULTISPECIES: GTP-binding protein [Hydrogenophaga]MBU4184403.1 sulfate adenylyltransferase [Gammaproteobacteria bacterium]MBU4282453.1 sulfate adenylyltransferase [Gammaproteobacteria bacterium]MCG2655722.1 GTP-binding protein [Hydrogenophaga sp.]UCU96560.1 sulfate adenylyltransferase [Hydrogenophaga taeniospiralis]